MRIGIFDPYFDTLGGAEKYVLEIASCLAGKHDVFLFWEDKEILKKATDRFGKDFSCIKQTENIFSSKFSSIKRIFETRNYDCIFYLSDGSFPLLLSKKNILIFQFPVNWVNGKKISTKIKLKRVSKIICYSDFVKKFLDKTFSINSVVLPPAINIPTSRKSKENIILTVGRYTRAQNAKKQEFLIETFKKMCDGGLSDWEFIVAGSVLPKDEDYVRLIKEKAKGYPIEVLENVPFEKLFDLYKTSKIYWHATGFGDDLKKHPERAEHFGISTVEAMASGAVPIVINAGGQKEIVQESENGFLWDSREELMKKTKELIKDIKLWNKLSTEAVKRAKYYNHEKFCERINELIK
ncbi:MAG: glycosyltransferase [Candidatus Levybacteria bacterium]|nr:glycosyltransferase [Candidatus Levybacteria bacterium]